MDGFLRAFVFAAAAGIVLASMPGYAQTAPVKAGVAAAVRGKVERAAFTPGAPASGAPVGIAVASGDVIYLGDRIATGPSAGLQIMLVDETVFTIGPNSAMAIDRFVYDPQTGTGQVAARVVQGAFRFVSGKIAKNDPKDMTVALPQGSIGVRGTAVQGVVEGERATVMLLGPGVTNNAGERPGRIVVTGNAGGEVLITRPGFATSLTFTTPPTEPVRLDAPQAVRLSSAVAPRANGASADDGASGNPDSQASAPQGQAAQGTAQAGGVVRQSGQGMAGALGPLGGTSQVAQLQQGAQQTVARAAQDAQTSLSEQTTWEQMRSIHSGTATYSFPQTNLVAIQGTGSGHYTLTMTVDFSARTATASYSGSYTVGQLNGAINAGNNPVKDYSTSTGFVTSNDSSGHSLPGGATMKTFYTMKNDVTNRVVAKTLENRVEISDVGGNNVIATQGGKISASR